MYKHKLEICMLVFLACTISHTTVQADSNLKPCKTDTDCPIQSYCYQKQYCTECTNCARYKKHNVTCAQTPYDCGSCLEGYQINPEDIHYDGTLPKSCVILLTKSTSGVTVMSNHTKPELSSIPTATPKPNLLEISPSDTEPTSIPTPTPKPNLSVTRTSDTEATSIPTPTPKPNLSEASASDTEPTSIPTPTSKPNLSEISSSDTEPTSIPTPTPKPNLSETSSSDTERTLVIFFGFLILILILILGIAVICIVLVNLRRRRHVANCYTRTTADVESENQNSSLNQSSETVSYANEDQVNTDSCRNLLEDRQNRTGTNARVQLTNLNIFNAVHCHLTFSSTEERGNYENALLLYRDNQCVSATRLDNQLDSEDEGRCQEIVIR